MADALLTAQADGTILEVPGYGKLLIARTTSGSCRPSNDRSADLHQ
jgi:hypothetical protein